MSFLAANQGQKIAQAFERAFISELGKRPPAGATQAIQKAATTIYAFAGTGQESRGSYQLAETINEYVLAVGMNNELEVACGLGALVSICCKKSGKPARGYRWAAETLVNAMMIYCPSAL